MVPSKSEIWREGHALNEHAANIVLFKHLKTSFGDMISFNRQKLILSCIKRIHLKDNEMNNEIELAFTGDYAEITKTGYLSCSFNIVHKHICDPMTHDLLSCDESKIAKVQS